MHSPFPSDADVGSPTAVARDNVAVCGTTGLCNSPSLTEEPSAGPLDAAEMGYEAQPDEEEEHEANVCQAGEAQRAIMTQIYQTVLQLVLGAA
jgi:hypothetical protein